jgi:ADP-ribosylglycohydrolase
LYCAFLFRDFEDAVIEAVNHSGDSDSTGAITGNICGALYGVESIPDRWLGQLELRSEITEIADDLAALDTGVFDASSEIAWQRYPGH